METIRWVDFARKNPIKVLKERGVDRIRVKYGVKGAYFNVYYHPYWEDDMAYEKHDWFVLDKKTGKKRIYCELCKTSSWRTRFIVPYDGSYPPGYYCYKCRRKYSIMDIKDAKRYNKVL